MKFKNQDYYLLVQLRIISGLADYLADFKQKKQKL
jgi:hypothetical protein